MDGNSTPTLEPGNFDVNSNSFYQVDTERSGHTNAEENSEDVISVSREGCEGHVDVRGVHISVPSDNNLSGETTSERELMRSEHKESDSQATWFDNATQGCDARTDANEALGGRITEKHAINSMENFNKNSISSTCVDSLHEDEYNGNATMPLNDKRYWNSVDHLGTEVKTANPTDASINGDGERCQRESFSAKETKTLSVSNT